MVTCTLQLPKPGQVVHQDFRPSQGPVGQSYHGVGTSTKLLQWNIERGYELDRVIQQLQQIDADVISLQEVDIGCERSGRKDTGALIAQALKLNYLFICEFEELLSELRDARSQGGGVHGNAILTKFDYIDWAVVEHSHHPIDWNVAEDQQLHPLAAKEPRRGRRLTLAANIISPQGPLRVYCCHLEVFCGISSRVWQFSDILLDAKQHMQHQQPKQGLANQAGKDSQQQQQDINLPNSSNIGLGSQYCCQAILGDLNTMGHGVARLSPNYCCDAMRWRSFGSTEAAWWQKHVLSVMEPCAVNKYLLQIGLPQEVAKAAVNPGFVDPFDVNKDITLDNPGYRVGPLHLMAGKLDWCLLRGMRVVQTALGNHDYIASDHRWLLVEVELLQQQQ